MDRFEEFVRNRKLNADWSSSTRLAKDSIYEYPIFFICENAEDVETTLLYDDVETLKELVHMYLEGAELKTVFPSTLVVDCPYIEIQSEIVSLFDLFNVHRVPESFWEYPQ